MEESLGFFVSMRFSKDERFEKKKKKKSFREKKKNNNNTVVYTAFGYFCCRPSSRIHKRRYEETDFFDETKDTICHQR